jgi:hypothetical protein
VKSEVQILSPRPALRPSGLRIPGAGRATEIRANREQIEIGR